MHRPFRAFTLIELLIVIAIIGILSTIVVSAVDIARDKGRDAALKSNVESVAQQAAIYDNQNGTYGTASGACNAGVYTDPTIVNALAAISAANYNGTTTCYAADTTYGMAAARPTSSLYTPDTPYWCVDSSGGKCGVNNLATLSTTGQCGCGS